MSKRPIPDDVVDDWYRPASYTLIAEDQPTQLVHQRPETVQLAR